MITEFLSATAISQLCRAYIKRDSFVTHRGFCNALAQETAKQAPPSFGSIGTHLFGSSSSVSLGSSPQLANLQIAQDNIQSQPSGAILGLGGGARTFGNILGQSSGSAFRPIHVLSASAPPFFSATAEPEFQEDSKQFIHGINTSSGGSLLGGLSFLSDGRCIDGGNNNSIRLYDDANVIAGDHNIFSAMNDTPLYSTSVPMSSTALLQKAAQLGSTSSNGGASLLKSFGSSSSGGTKSGNLGGIFGGLTSGGTNFNDLIYSLTAGGSSSIFGSGGLEDGDRYGGWYNGLGFGKVDVGAAGPDRSVLTRDFLGMGQIVRSVSGGLEMEMEMGLMDSKEKAAPKHQLPFGCGGNFLG